MLCFIRSNRKVKNNLSGYSKMNKTQLIETLKKYLDEGEKHPRVVKETEWSKALRVFNECKDSYVIPKKDSKEYAEVQKIIANGGKKVDVAKQTHVATQTSATPKQKRSKVTPLPTIVTKAVATKRAVPEEDEGNDAVSSKKSTLRKNPKRKIIFADDDE